MSQLREMHPTDWYINWRAYFINAESWSSNYGSGVFEGPCGSF